MPRSEHALLTMATNRAPLDFRILPSCTARFTRLNASKMMSFEVEVGELQPDKFAHPYAGIEEDQKDCPVPQTYRVSIVAAVEQPQDIVW